MRLSQLGLAFLMLISTMLVHAAPPPGGLRLYGADKQLLAQAPQLATDVSIEVSGLLLRVRVVQRFSNPTNDWSEGIYTFPLPENAAVDRLRMRYAERVIEGEVREKQAARRQYREARREGRGATLLDQQRANVFTSSVANIPPGESVEVTIEYQQQAQWREQTFALRFPMVVAPRYIPGKPVDDGQPRRGPGWADDTDQVADASLITPPVLAGAGAAFNPVSIRVDLHAGLPLAALESPYHAIVSEQLSPGHHRVELARGQVPGDRDFELRWRPQLGHAPAAALFTQRWDGHHYGLLMVMPPHEVPAHRVPPRELILVVDTSGSMHGESIEQARAALDTALGQLRPGDRFNVVQFNDRVHSLFADARPADADNLRAARDYVGRLQAEGGTQMLPALRHALQGERNDGLLRQVVFLTDGAVGNEQALFELIARRIGNSRLFTVGIGSAPNALFMRGAARTGRGSFAYIGKADEVAAKMSVLFRRLSAPVLTDLSLQWSAEHAEAGLAQAPQRLPDLYADEPLVVAVRSTSALQAVRIAGRFDARPWQRDVPLDGGEDVAGVHVLWARRMIAAQLARRLSGGDEAAIRESVIALALEHHLVSPYTSLVVVDRTPSRPSAEGLSSSALASRLPAGWSAEAVFGRLPSTATFAPLMLLVGLVGLATAFLLRRGR